MTYTTATLIEAEIRASELFSTATTPSLAQVTTWITETDAYIDHLTANAFAQTTYTDEYIDYNGESELILKHSPVIAVNSLMYNTNTLGSSDGEGFITKAAGTDYIVRPESGTILLPYTTFSPNFGLRRFKATYSAGYATTPAVVQMLSTKMVASRVLDSLFAGNTNSGETGGSISVGSISIVDPANVGVGTYKELKTGIKELQNDLVRNFSVYRYG
jgi:hypothetical protein